MFSFGLSPVVSKAFIADFEHGFFCWKRYSTKPVVVLIVKYLAQQTKTYSKSSVETPKANSRDCASLLTTCSISKTLFKCFLVTMNMSLFTAMFLLLPFIFRCIYCQFSTDFTPWSTDLLLSVFHWVEKKPPDVFFKKRCPLKLRNIFRKTPLLGSLFNKVVGLQDCKFIKKRLQHRCFVRNLRKFSRTPFLKNICERLLL